MSEGERISSEVVIANRTYPLKIFKQDEERIKNVVKNVNQKIEQLRALYDAKDNQDYLAMCLLQMSIQQINTSSADLYAPELEAQIRKIEELLS